MALNRKGKTVDTICLSPWRRLESVDEFFVVYPFFTSWTLFCFGWCVEFTRLDFFPLVNDLQIRPFLRALPPLLSVSTAGA